MASDPRVIFALNEGAEKRNTTLWFDDNFVGTERTSGELRQGREGRAERVKAKPMADLAEMLRARWGSSGGRVTP